VQVQEQEQKQRLVYSNFEGELHCGALIPEACDVEEGKSLAKLLEGRGL